MRKKKEVSEEIPVVMLAIISLSIVSLEDIDYSWTNLIDEVVAPRM